MLVVLDLNGQFLDVGLISHNESLVVGTPYGAGGDGGSLVYLDG